ncbi:decaprenyl-phosphate phosphoribosyltransferase [Desulfonatronospira sp.]|uniref:decaprenyl-phosphate phosphoribosyltransferase n=1 Tax=Desulfonatronospira sp. TaxID=1962951 RepID=UPI0025BEA779|nr:decaprenyl-phosphate phosphoribosyltransferase [Desulfonatronospira sp.]
MLNKAYIPLLRPHQYIKNLFVFAPLFFSFRFLEAEPLFRTFTAFAAFCLVASSVYIFNDIKDIAEDSRHPLKKHRPLPRGLISISRAYICMAVLLIAGLGLGLALDWRIFFILAGYSLLNTFYTVKLKHVAVLDVFIIGIGFVLRIFAGAMAAGVLASMWIVLMTFLLALFLALAKRRDDVLLSGEGRDVRKCIDGYNLEFVNVSMIIMAAVTLVSYIMYTISPEVQDRFDSRHLYLSAVFVLMGIMRYLQIVFVHQGGGNPTRVMLEDRFMQTTVACWLLFFLILALT